MMLRYLRTLAGWLTAEPPVADTPSSPCRFRHLALSYFVP